MKPEDLSIEQLIEAMEKTRGEIVEREKLNQARLKALQDKVAKLKARMDTFTDNPKPPVKLNNDELIPPHVVPMSAK